MIRDFLGLYSVQTPLEVQNISSLVQFCMLDLLEVADIMYK